MNPGDDITIMFEGFEHQGEFIEDRGRGWVTAKMLVDPLGDYGSISARLAPISIVTVRNTDVRLRQDSQEIPDSP